MMRYGIVACALALGLAACGDSGSTSGTQSLACDVGAGTQQHFCLEFSWDGPATTVDPYKGQCNAAGATTVSACPSSGKVGGCKYSTTSGSYTVTWTNWFYFGTAAQDMAACVSQGSVTATWVNP